MNGTAQATVDTGILSMRLALTVTHLLLVSLGSVNVLVIFVIVLRPYMRSITNVYMIGLCLADFIYLINLTLVAATQLNDKSWAFGSFVCTLYHGTESTGKYASVMFVVLLAADRYCAMCKSSLCARYRNYRAAMLATGFAWIVAIGAAAPLYVFAEVSVIRIRGQPRLHRLCIAKWPSSDTARWYITFSSILIFAMPLILIVYFYYNILNKLREALKGSKRLQRASSSRAPYHRVTRLVLWVVIFHVICWSPFWLFNLFSSIFRLRIQTQFDRIVINIIHLFPYVNCALNPLLYAVQAENFRTAFRSLFMRRASHSRMQLGHRRGNKMAQASCYRPEGINSIRDRLIPRATSASMRDRRVACNARTHSVLRMQSTATLSKTIAESMSDTRKSSTNSLTTHAIADMKYSHGRSGTFTRTMNGGNAEGLVPSVSPVHYRLSPICSEDSNDLNEEEQRLSDANLSTARSSPIQSSLTSL